MEVQFCLRSLDPYIVSGEVTPYICPIDNNKFIIYDEKLSGQRYLADADTSEDPFRYIYDSDGRLVWKSYKMKEAYSASQESTRLSIT